MEALSRKLRVSLFVPYGRFLLPIPRRTNITMLIGSPIEVEKVEKPTEAQIDAVHARLLSEMEELFDAHKASLGCGHRRIVFK